MMTEVFTHGGTFHVSEDIEEVSQRIRESLNIDDPVVAFTEPFSNGRLLVFVAQITALREWGSSGEWKASA